MEIHEIAPPSSNSPQATSNEPKQTPAPPTSSEVVVDVTGAVKTAGIQRLPAGSRVDDAVKAAGAAGDADLEQINLAAKLEDGTNVFVPHKGAANSQPVAEIYRGGASAPPKYAVNSTPHEETHTGRHSGPKQPAGKVHLNTASMEQLETLPGIGPATAQKILAYRQDHGGFTSVEELLAVGGIGDKKMEKLRPWIEL